MATSSADGERTGGGSQHRRQNVPVLRVRDLAKSYGTTRALQGVSFELRSGLVYGLIGVNGSGKSTLMKILAGAEQASDGEMALDETPYRPRNVAHAGRLGIGMVPQELPIVPHISVADNVFMGQWHTRFGALRGHLSRTAARAVLRELGAETDVGARAGDLKLGEQQLTVIARTLTRRPRVVLLDEPTSALAGGEVTRLRQVIRGIAEQGRTVLIISQRLDDVFGVCDHVMVLRNGRLVESAPVTEFSSDRAIDLMMHGHDGPPSKPKVAATTADTREPPGDTADGITAALATADLVVHGRTGPVSLRLDRGEIVGLAGLPGSGTSEFLRALAGLRPASAREAWLFGERYRPGRPGDAIGQGIAYVTGDRQAEGLVPDSSVANNITMVRMRTGWGGPRHLAAARRAALEQIAALRIRPGDPDQPVRALSGGNQQKVVFARWMLASPKLWLLDDATRGVDIGARREIHSAVRAMTSEGHVAALMVSSDLFELFEVCDRIVVFRDGAVIADMPSAKTTPEAVETLTAGLVREPA